MTFLVHFPTEILAHVFCDWCQSPYLIMLDTASTNKVWRKILLEVFILDHFVLKTGYRFCGKVIKMVDGEPIGLFFNLMEWMLRRSLKVSQIEIIVVDGTDKSYHCADNKLLHDLNCSEVTTLKLKNYFSLSTCGLYNLIKNCPKLTSVDLIYVEKFDDEFISTFAKILKFEQLTCLNLSGLGNDKLTETGLNYFVEFGSNLKSVTLGLIPISVDFLKRLMTSNKSLTSLRFNPIEHDFTKEHLLMLSTHFAHQLQSLTIKFFFLFGQIRELTFDTICLFLEQSKSLTHFRLIHGQENYINFMTNMQNQRIVTINPKDDGISTQQINTFFKSLHNLQITKLANCHVNHELFDILVEKSPKL